MNENDDEVTDDEWTAFLLKYAWAALDGDDDDDEHDGWWV